MLLGATGARADQAESPPETQRLRDAGEALAAESQSVVLELYALESRLGRVQARLTELEAAASEVEREQEAARRNLRILRANLAEANGRLAERLRQLYTEADTDPLAVLLGAESLDEVVSTLDNLGRFARQDRRIVRRVQEGRRNVERALDDLAERESKLESLTRAAAATHAELVAARGERRAYLARLRAERRVNAAELTRLAAAAQTAEQKSAEIVPVTASAEGGGGASPSAPPPPSPPATVPDAPVAAGAQLTVVATGYSLTGTTATGIPVGWGVVAVDPAVIPLGTRMTIPGYGEGVAADTGSAVSGAVIDLWFPTRAQALAWGRRTVTITLH
jgi:3D (Asp-Asp-Asp) domain-containing protein/peptidoglycan hydrolase CwlO-like protein